MGCRTILAGVAGLVLALMASPDITCAAPFKVLHAFEGGSDGQWPQAGLVRDRAGNLYGTTFGGGGSGGGPGKRCAKSCGNAYQLTPSGTESVLYSFTGIDGALPEAPLLAHAGVLYGTTYSGGLSPRRCGRYNFGCGTVFQLTKRGAETVLYEFCSKPKCADGAHPVAGVIADGAGNLYGTTSDGGRAGCVRQGCGSVYKLAPDGIETVLYAFCKKTNCTDGQTPVGGVIADSAGNLYGTVSFGGANAPLYEGAVFKLTPDGRETLIYSFCADGYPACADGSQPEAGLIADAAGNLYGTTASGGGTGCGGQGCGIIFEITSTGTEIVLHAFQGGEDGGVPEAPLIRDEFGNLYGTTVGGGSTGCYGGAGCGTVFKLAPDGRERILHAFCSRPNCADGNQPQSGLVLENGFFYGTALYGGRSSKCFGLGCGTVFKLRNPG